MSRKRGKKKKPVVEAIPDDLLAAGSGPIGGPPAEPIATVEDVVTSEDVVTTEDIVTADDVVATTAEPETPETKDGSDEGSSAAPGADDQAAQLAHDDTTDGELTASAEGADAAERAETADSAEMADSFDAADGFDDTAQRVEAAADGAEPGEGEDAGADDGGDDDAPVFPTSATSMDAVQLKHLVEALIFASDRPLTVQRLRQLARVSDVRRLQQSLVELEADYRERGVVLQQVSGGYQFRTRTQFSAWVQQLIAGRPVRLSRAQLETLAIIAYRQPITRPEIDDIRGVDSSNTLKLLLDRMLIRVLGKREEVGRPTLYGTTKEFLDFFSLGDLRELPTLREYSELTAESRKVMSDRLGIPADGSEGGAGAGGPEDGGGGEGTDEGSTRVTDDALAAFVAAAEAVDRSEADELAEGAAPGILEGEAADPALGAEPLADDPAVELDAAAHASVQLDDRIEPADAAALGEREREAAPAGDERAVDASEDAAPAEAMGPVALEPELLEADILAQAVEAEAEQLDAVEAVDLEVRTASAGSEPADLAARAVEADAVEPAEAEAVAADEGSLAAEVELAAFEAGAGEVVDVEPVDVEPVDVEPVDVEPVDVEPVDVDAMAIDAGVAEAEGAEPVEVETVDLDAIAAEAGGDAADLEALANDAAALAADGAEPVEVETVDLDAMAADAGNEAEELEADVDDGLAAGEAVTSTASDAEAAADERPAAPRSGELGGQVGGDAKWPVGSPPFSVIASAEDRPVERPVMDSNAIGTAALDDNLDGAAPAATPPVDPAAE